jgi:hypothetical protein
MVYIVHIALLLTFLVRFICTFAYDYKVAGSTTHNVIEYNSMYLINDRRGSAALTTRHPSIHKS